MAYEFTYVKKISVNKLGFGVSVCVTLFQLSLPTFSYIIQIFPIYIVYVLLEGTALKLKNLLSWK